MCLTWSVDCVHYNVKKEIYEDMLKREKMAKLGDYFFLNFILNSFLFVNSMLK